MISLLTGLALAGMRKRKLPAILTVILCAAAGMTIVMALEVGSTASSPWQKTFDTANGAHIWASLVNETDLQAFAGTPGVSEIDEPLPVDSVRIVLAETEVPVFITGVREPTINRPIVMFGREAGPGEALLERSLANALNLPVGSTVMIGESPLVVSGYAISPSQPRYPRSNPGLIWLSRETFEQISPDPAAWRWTQGVRLINPEDAPRIAAAALADFAPNTVYFETWQEQRTLALQESQPITVILLSYSLLLLVVSIAVVAILMTARITDQLREVALLKALGVTPRQLRFTYMIESVALGAVGVVLGFLPAVVLAPRFLQAAATTMVEAPIANGDGRNLVIALILVLPVIAICAYRAARRATTSVVMYSLTTSAAGVPPTSRVVRWIDAVFMPLPLAIGLRDMLARRSRSICLGGSMLICAAAMLASLWSHAAINDRPEGSVSDVPAELPMLIYMLDIMLAVIVVTALMAVALLTVRERVRDFGILRTVGFSPGQLVSSIAGSHMLLALIASALAIPFGALLFLAMLGGSGGDVSVSAWQWSWAILVPLATMAVAAMATGVPGWFATRIPAATAVRFE